MTKTFIGTFHELQALLRNISHKECFIQISVISFVIYSHIQIHNIAILKFSRIWNSMTDNLIYRTNLIPIQHNLRTNTLREEVIIQRRRIRIALDTLLQNNLINLFRCNTHMNSISSSIQHLSSHTTRLTHSLNIMGCFILNSRTLILFSF